MSKVLVTESYLSDIADAIRAKGNLSSSITFKPSEMANGIYDLQGNIARKAANFYDYDGTLLYSYDLEEVENLTELPSNPTHPDLTAKGWNWSLSDIKSFLQNYEEINVGQLYSTSNGSTKIYVTLESGRLSPYLYLCFSGTATINWGDGNTETISGSGTSFPMSILHEYHFSGDYVISISGASEIKFVGDTFQGCKLLCLDNNGNTNNNYQGAITKIETSDMTTYSFDSYAFCDCRNLKYFMWPYNQAIFQSETNLFTRCYNLEFFVFPKTPGSTVPEYCFGDCYSLKNVIIDGQTSNINEGAFSACFSLNDITIPCSNIEDYAYSNCSSLKRVVTNAARQIGSYAFSECNSLEFFIFSPLINTIGTYIFNSCKALVEVAAPPMATIANLPANIFNNCLSLRRVYISGLRDIGQSSFANCESLSYINLSEVNIISNNAFDGCASLGTIDFSGSSTIPASPTLGTINNDYKIVVPDSLYSMWTMQWSNYSSHIIKASDWNN